MKVRRRIQLYYTSRAAELLVRRTIRIPGNKAMISFSFDDFPRSAWREGGAILKGYDVRGTYYAAFGLMETYGSTGEMFRAEDVRGLLDEGHELGSHTFDHLDASSARPSVFEASIIRNRMALADGFPGSAFRTFSYPLAFPTLGIKRVSAKHFEGCRSGGQCINVGRTDLNHLHAYFLEQSIERPDAIEALIEENARRGGWLIFVTHDVSSTPSRFGCSPEALERTVGLASASGAAILPVAEALRALGSQ